MSNFEVERYELAGFDLAGRRQEDGTIKLYLTDRVIDDWPKEITFHGPTYTLEKVVKGKNGYESGIYV